MCQNLLRDTSLFQLLTKIDEVEAAKARADKCPFCGDSLDNANYPRKPRGGPAAERPEYGLRFSLCCRREGCRKRTTPASVRFLGRRVYLEFVFVLVCVMTHGESPRRIAKLRQLVGVDRRTVKRWQTWWREIFAESALFKRLRGLLQTPIDNERLPNSLMDRFEGDERDKLVSMLKQLRPLSTTSAVL